MKILRKRSVSVVITVVVVLLSIIFGVHRSLGQDARAVSDQFSVGVNADYLRPSIRGQLEVRTAASLTLITAGNNYKEVSDKTAALRDVRNHLMDLLADEDAPAEMYRANAALQTAYENLYRALESCDLSDIHKSDMEDCLKKFNGAASVIESSGYNESVREFNRSVLGVFPTNLLWRIAFVEKPQLFE